GGGGEGGGGGGEEGRPPPQADHGADGALGHPVGAGQVGVEHRGEVFLAHQGEELVTGDPGVGHQHLDGAVLRFRLPERLVNGGRVTHVTTHDGHPVHVLAGTGGDRDGVPVGRQPPGDS